MIIDTSAIVAILLDEPERELFTRLIGAAPDHSISAGSRIELTVVALRKGGWELEAHAGQLLFRLGTKTEPVSISQSDYARNAYIRYGRGSGHPAKLNFGDCFAYALAREAGQPLLFKGEDFRLTDIRAAA